MATTRKATSKRPRKRTADLALNDETGPYTLSEALESAAPREESPYARQPETLPIPPGAASIPGVALDAGGEGEAPSAQQPAPSRSQSDSQLLAELTAHDEEEKPVPTIFTAEEPGLTKSQLTTIAGTAAAVLGAVESQLDVLGAFLPERYANLLRAVVIIGGALLAAFNQSVNTNHISIPKAQIQGLKWQDAVRAGLGVGKAVAPGAVGKGVDIASDILGGAPQEDARVEQLVTIARTHESRIRLLEAKTGLK